MPLATLHLLQLLCKPEAFLATIKGDPSISVILSSIPQIHVIRPQKIDTQLLNQSWDLLLLIISRDDSNPNANLLAYTSQIKTIYSLPVGIPSRILSTYPQRNAELLSQVSSANANLTGALEEAERATKSSSQNLELSPELLGFMKDFTAKYGLNQPVTMLNLLHFTPPDGKRKYAQYGKAFVEVAGLRGGDAKLVGNVLPSQNGLKDGRDGRAEDEWWNEFSLVHYPSIRAFCDMLAGEDYQLINRNFRLGALADTVLICTKEIEDGGRSKL